MLSRLSLLLPAARRPGNPESSRAPPTSAPAEVDGQSPAATRKSKSEIRKILRNLSADIGTSRGSSEQDTWSHLHASCQKPNPSTHTSGIGVPNTAVANRVSSRM